jgi:transposase
MRGHIDSQSHLSSYFSPEERVPAGHPLRSIEGYTESALTQIGLLLEG